MKTYGATFSPKGRATEKVKLSFVKESKEFVKSSFDGYVEICAL